MTEAIKEQAREAAVMVVRAHAFKNRKGHGGGPCTKRVLDRDQLTRLIHESISRYQDFLKHYERKRL